MNFAKFFNNAQTWIVESGLKFLVGILILCLGLWIIKLLLRWMHNALHAKSVDATIKDFLLSLVGLALRILLVLAVMNQIGIELTLFTAIVGAFGVAAGLALSGTLQNFASGILILLLKPFVVGDNIITQGTEGTVMSIEIFYTLIKTFDNRTVIVPNSKLSNEVIINISREGSRRLDIEMKFPNSVDIKEIKNVIGGAIDRSEHCLKQPERRIGVATLENDGYKIGINVWVNAHGFQDSKLIVQENILQTIKDSGIKLPGM